MIVILDYKVGNLGSILNMLRKIGADAIISSEPDEVRKADKFILPGVGAFDHGIKCLRESRFFSILEDKVLGERTPLLGICLGMQLLANSSEEGIFPGLGWIDADFKRFRFDSDSHLKIPHMGWNYLAVERRTPLFSDMGEKKPRFYFVHSYHAVVNKLEVTIAKTCYGYDFVSAYGDQNIYGVQFHPEKSHQFGMQMLQNFVERC